MIAALIFFVAAFCVSTYTIGARLIGQKKAQDAFDALVAQLDTDLPPQPGTDAASGPGACPSDGAPAASEDVGPSQDIPHDPPAGPGFHKYDALYAQNSDLFGWVRIDGTKVNYPVMYTPEEPERYLHRAFDGTESLCGVPFMDGACRPGCGNYIIYGHHMKNGTMFGMLPDYASEAFWREHPTILFDTLDGPGEYEVLGAFYSRVYGSGDTDVFRCYDYTDLTDEALFDEYMTWVRRASLYYTGVTAQYGDQILTLITCSYHTAEGRFVVVARRSPDVQVP